MKYWLFFLITLFAVQETFAADTQLFPTRHDWKYVEKTQLDLTRFLLPDTSALKKKLDVIFKNPSIFENALTLQNAGFTIRYIRRSGLIIASHAAVPGYLFKLYFADKNSVEAAAALTQRCVGAAYIRNLINKHRLRYFTVPNKSLYKVQGGESQYVLVVDEMHIVSHEKSIAIWKTRIQPKHLQELYLILKHGYPSLALTHNVPYTKEGKFACIDTEYPKRAFALYRVQRHLSKKMCKYWEKLTSEKKPRSSR